MLKSQNNAHEDDSSRLVLPVPTLVPADKYKSEDEKSPVAASEPFPTTFAREIHPLHPYPHAGYQSCLGCIGGCFGCLAPCLPCCCSDSFHVIPQGNAGVVARFGQVVRVVDPGLCYTNQCTEEVALVDIRVRMTDVPRQVVMTRDNVSVNVDPVLFWRVADPYAITCRVDNLAYALTQRTLTAMRDTIGSHTLQSVIENRNAISKTIRSLTDSVARSWGVVIEAILIKDLRVSTALEKELASAAKQKRVGEGRVIEARADVETAKQLREASDILATPAAMQIRELNTMHLVAQTLGAQVVFAPKGCDDAIGKVTESLMLEQMMASRTGM